MVLAPGTSFLHCGLTILTNSCGNACGQLKSGTCFICSFLDVCYRIKAICVGLTIHHRPVRVTILATAIAAYSHLPWQRYYWCFNLEGPPSVFSAGPKRYNSWQRDRTEYWAYTCHSSCESALKTLSCHRGSTPPNAPPSPPPTSAYNTYQMSSYGAGWSTSSRSGWPRYGAAACLGWAVRCTATAGFKSHRRRSLFFHTAVPCTYRLISRPLSSIWKCWFFSSGKISSWCRPLYTVTSVTGASR